MAGNWPYWKTEELEAHPDELLRARLRFSDENKSLIEHDLFELAQGLEGRTTNPVSLLVNNLIVNKKKAIQLTNLFIFAV